MYLFHLNNFVHMVTDIILSWSLSNITWRVHCKGK